MIPTRTLFERHGLRCTRQRVEIYEALAATKCHPTAEQLHRMVGQKLPQTSLATVYNTLDALTSAGLCKRIATSGGGTRYDADIHQHLHLFTRDGRILDVPSELGQRVLAGIPRDAIERLEREMGVKITHAEVHLQAS